MARKKPVEEKETADTAGLDIQAILKRSDACDDFWDEIYERGQEDVDFVLGDGNQWPEKIKSKREKQGRPCLEENRMLPFVHQVINSIRQARPSIIPKPVDDKADVVTADILRGLILNIETISDASSVYDTGARNSVMGSVGWIRVVTDYCGPDTFDQEARLERIQNFQSVKLDPNHQRQDGSDARYGFVYSDMDLDVFKDTYPDAKTDGFEKAGWLDDKTIRVAEYFYKEEEERELCEYELPTMAGVVKGAAFRDKLPAGAIVGRTRKAQICKVKYAKITAGEILEEGTFPGEYIPLIPIVGFETYTNDKRTFFSLVHQGKDPQRLLNYYNSTAAEVVALQPKAPYIGAKGQFSSFPESWQNANNDNVPFLEYDPVLDDNGMQVPPPQRQPPVSTSPGLLQEKIASGDAIKAALGMFDAAMGQQSQDISGKAIISRQMQGDNATFHFIDNLVVGMRQVGRVLIGIIPIIYTGQRIIRILGEDGKEALVPLNQSVTKEDGQWVKAADPAVSRVIRFDAGKYDVVVEVGPSYATRRQELSNAIVELARISPEIMAAAGDLLIESLDIPKAEVIAKRIRATMDPKLLGDDVEAKRAQELMAALEQLQNKLQLTEEALLAKKNNEEFKNSLEAKKVENETIQLQITAAKTMAEIQKMQAETKGDNADAMKEIAGIISSLGARVDDVSGALHVLLSKAEEEGTGTPGVSVNESPVDGGQPIASAA